jgi:CBS domain-containing protein
MGVDVVDAGRMSKEPPPRSSSGQRPDDVDEVAVFLAGHAPFAELEPDERRRIAASVARREVAAGEAVLVEGGPPGSSLFIVRSGTMEFRVGEVLLDTLMAGEMFGAPTLLSGSAPEITVRAREDAVLYLVQRRVALDFLARREVMAFVAATLRDRLVRTARAIRSTSDVRSVPVSSLIRRSPVFCDPGTQVREVARIMTDEIVTAVLVRTREGLGIVTDADLRNKVLADGFSADMPVASIMSMPARTIRAELLAPEASLEMMQAGINHLVVVDARGGVLGIISAGSLMAPDALSPFALRWSISAAGSEDEVVAAAGRLPGVFVALCDAHLDAPALSRVLTFVSDALTRRLLELAESRLGRPPAPYAWLALGGAARSEISLTSDQDNALAYADTDDPAADAYFAGLGDAVNRGLERCGFALDKSGVLARDEHWRMSRSEWVRVFRDCYEVWDWAHAARACIAFDFRRVHGDLDVVTPLTEVVLEAPEHPALLNRLARTVIDLHSPLGFRQRLPETLDIKKGALLPIENIARYYALAHRIGVSATLDRLCAAGEIGALGAEATSALQLSFRAMTQVRLRHHADAIRAGRRPDDDVVTASLDPLTRVDVVEALRLVAAAQKRVPRVVMP